MATFLGKTWLLVPVVSAAQGMVAVHLSGSSSGFCPQLAPIPLKQVLEVALVNTPEFCMHETISTNGHVVR
jgi:hypothetical protein